MISLEPESDLSIRELFLINGLMLEAFLAAKGDWISRPTRTDVQRSGRRTSMACSVAFFMMVSLLEAQDSGKEVVG
jgi:hypothetical protein